ncbi:hypothetical protein BDV28DRAFT_134257 [Aspergillus coremiiformis]|uniref:Uncharacterized protein n=1 Tax=Aspergillus coremiiformis TaxID=138285 RepID=A0A5N6Z5G1_9EURO|nr:hypothetical protein BDV28DRAFT_134257 [Aspergillus coremiiformis]
MFSYDRKRLIPAGNVISNYHPLRPWFFFSFSFFCLLSLLVSGHLSYRGALDWR